MYFISILTYFMTLPALGIARTSSALLSLLQSCIFFLCFQSHSPLCSIKTKKKICGAIMKIKYKIIVSDYLDR